MEPPKVAELRARAAAAMAAPVNTELRRHEGPDNIIRESRTVELRKTDAAALVAVARWASGCRRDGDSAALLGCAGHLNASMLVSPSDWEPAGEIAAEGAFFRALAAATQGRIGAMKWDTHKAAPRFVETLARAQALR